MLTDSFWSEQKDKLFSVVLPIFLDIVNLGVEDGILALGVEVGVDLDKVSMSAIKWLRTYTFDLVKGINDTTADFLRTSITEWVQSGRPLSELADVLQNSHLWSESRAENIATTEVTRAYAQGNLISWRESGIVKKKMWLASEDELVCDICGYLHKQVVGLDEQWGELDAPPAHPRCRCYLHPVVE